MFQDIQELDFYKDYTQLHSCCTETTQKEYICSLNKFVACKDI